MRSPFVRSLSDLGENTAATANRVTLAERTDAFWIPPTRLDWRLGDAEIRSVRRADTTQKIVARAFRRADQVKQQPETPAGTLQS